MMLDELQSVKAVYKSDGVAGTALLGGTRNIDWVAPENLWLAGVRLVLTSHLFGDTFTVQIIDKDNVLGGGANVVTYEMLSNYYIVTDQQQQGFIEFPTPLPVYSGTYVRFKYTTAALITAATIKCNVFYYKPVSSSTALP